MTNFISPLDEVQKSWKNYSTKDNITVGLSIILKRKYIHLPIQLICKNDTVLCNTTGQLNRLHILINILTQMDPNKAKIN